MPKRAVFDGKKAGEFWKIPSLLPAKTGLEKDKRLELHAWVKMEKLALYIFAKVQKKYRGRIDKIKIDGIIILRHIWHIRYNIQWGGKV